MWLSERLSVSSNMLTLDQSARSCIISSQAVLVQFPNFLQVSPRSSNTLHVTPIIPKSPQPNHYPACLPQQDQPATINIARNSPLCPRQPGPTQRRMSRNSLLIFTNWAMSELFSHQSEMLHFKTTTGRVFDQRNYWLALVLEPFTDRC